MQCLCFCLYASENQPLDFNLKYWSIFAIFQIRLFLFWKWNNNYCVTTVEKNSNHMTIFDQLSPLKMDKNIQNALLTHDWGWHIAPLLVMKKNTRRNSNNPQIFYAVR